MFIHAHFRGLRATVTRRLGIRFCLLLVYAWLAAGMLEAAENSKAYEAQVKAAFLINFPKYVDWLPEAFEAEDSPIVFGILGETDVYDGLRKMTADKIFKGRKVVLRRVATVEESNNCHILFIAAEAQERSPDLLGKLRGSHILTVGENNDFLDHGGVINLALRDQKISLQVNLNAAGNAGLRISSKLLSVASVVRGKRE